MKKALSLLLCVLLTAALLPFAAFPASAQECAWSYYIGETCYNGAAALNDAHIPGLYVMGGALTLDNYTGTSIAAIPGGLIGDDDSPVLRITLKGTNTLTGSYFSSVSGYTVPSLNMPGSGTIWLGAIYAEERAGGTGADSQIVVSGDGTLNININCPTFNSVNIKAVSCGSLLQMKGGTVNINFGGKGQSCKEAIGVACPQTELGSSAVLNIKGSIGPFIRKQGDHLVRTPSTCAVSALSGNINVKANMGYFAADVTGCNTSSASVACVKGDVDYQNAYSALFLTAQKSGVLTTGTITYPTNWTPGNQFANYEFETDSMRYLAYGPSGTDGMNTNTSLTELTPADVLPILCFPQAGSARPAATAYTAYTTRGCYAKTDYAKIDTETGQAYINTSWDNFEVVSGDEYAYEFYLSFYPMPGRWVLFKSGSMTKEKIAAALEYEPYDAGSLLRGIYISYVYLTPIITTQPLPIDENAADIEVIAQIDKGNLTYEWFIDVYGDNSETPAATVSMTEFDEMGYDFTDQTEPKMNIGSLDADETVPGCDFTYGEASKILIYCHISSVGSSTDTDKVPYAPFTEDFLNKSIAVTGVTLTPNAGETAGSLLNYNIPADAHYTTGTHRWYNDTKKAFMSATDTFEAGSKYSLFWRFVAEDAYYFNDKTSTTVNNSTAAIDTVETNVDDFNNTTYYLWTTPVTVSSGHTHNHTGEWKYDKTNHWQLCSCGDTGNKAVHTFGSWAVTKNATETAKGIKERTCTVCGFKEAADIQVLAHTHSAGSVWKYDTASHWKECTCGEKLNKAAHSLSAPVYNKDAKCYTQACACGYVYKYRNMGDVDGDGQISAADARLALRCSVKLESFTGVEAAACNADGDGSISAADARLILRASVKLEDNSTWKKIAM